MDFLVRGFVGALLELEIFFGISTIMLKYFQINFINKIAYYWLCFTILTGIWEMFYVIQHKAVVFMSNNLLVKKQHVWCKKYDIDMVFPWKLSRIFYAEYGAYADREYMTCKDNWSRIIEGTHCLLCAIFSFFTIYYYNLDKLKYSLCLGISMGSQLMNSILYMGEYFIQTKNKDSVNFDSEAFPCGKLLLKRPFMWINIFWTIMPLYILTTNLL